jgi:hypothetical protein
LKRDVQGRAPTVRELAAAGLFLANLYSGVENILKRIARFHQLELPSGADWHIELVKAFGQPLHIGLPVLLPSSLASLLAPYRRFRHVVHHSYGFQLRWDEMLPGIEGAAPMVTHFRNSVDAYIGTVINPRG